MMKNIYMLLICLATACNSISKDVLQLESAPIKLPKEKVITFRDVESNGYFNSRLKLVVFTDSLSCGGCAINKLFLWEDLIKWSDHYRGDLKFYFIFNPPKGENIRLAMRNSMLDYPMLLDSLGEFERLNPHLPKNKAMHTFLLDENNNVVLVGNPVYNPKIEKMFKEIVEEELGKKE